MVGAVVSAKHGKSLELTLFWQMWGVILSGLIYWGTENKTNRTILRPMSNFQHGYLITCHRSQLLTLSGSR
jgi:hypothetical protein